VSGRSEPDFQISLATAGLTTSEPSTKDTK
jgi:hypothetical protein